MQTLVNEMLDQKMARMRELADVALDQLIAFHATLFDRNLLVYVDYLINDLGDPPDEGRAREIARRTGLTIRFEHPGSGWQTGAIPPSFDLKRAWIRKHAAGIWTGSSKGHHFIRLDHGGGRLLFVVPLDTSHAAFAMRMGLFMVVAVALLLGLAYLYLRRLLKPLRVLKTGVDAVGSGRLAHRIPETGRHEFADLARTFNTMADRLARLLQSKERLLLDVSHELRSPITRMKVQLEFLDDAEGREALGSDVAEMESMVTALLDSARMRHAAAAFDLDRVNLGGLARDLAADFKDRPPGGRLGPVVEKPVPADPEKMCTVLRNLLDNALKYASADGPQVELSMAAKPEVIEIVVADEGAGIPAEEIPRLFEPFYRPDTSRSRKTGGYGLGLSLCKAIIDAHGGTIGLTSTPGQGTRVTVTLPWRADALPRPNPNNPCG